MTIRRLADTFRDRDVHVRGLSLRVRERGPQDGAPGLLLHGWLEHRGSFDRLAPLLPGRTIAYDQRGHGDSSWVGAGGFYHFPDYLGDLDGLCLAMGTEGPLRLVGHSMGAAVGLLYAAARPEKVRHVTLLDGAPLPLSAAEVPARLTGWLDDLRAERRRRPVASIEDAVERLRRANPALSLAAAELLAREGVSPDPRRGGALAWKWDPLLRARSPLPFTAEVLRELLPRVRARVLLLRGERGLVPPEAAARAGGILSLTIETIPAAGHHLHLDQPETVAERIRHAWEAL